MSVKEYHASAALSKGREEVAIPQQWAFITNYGAVLAFVAQLRAAGQREHHHAAIVNTTTGNVNTVTRIVNTLTEHRVHPRGDRQMPRG